MFVAPGHFTNGVFTKGTRPSRVLTTHGDRPMLFPARHGRTPNSWMDGFLEWENPNLIAGWWLGVALWRNGKPHLWNPPIISHSIPVNPKNPQSLDVFGIQSAPGSHPEPGRPPVSATVGQGQDSQLMDHDGSWSPRIIPNFCKGSCIIPTRANTFKGQWYYNSRDILQRRSIYHSPKKIKANI